MLSVQFVVCRAHGHEHLIAAPYYVGAHTYTCPIAVSVFSSIPKRVTTCLALHIDVIIYQFVFSSSKFSEFSFYCYSLVFRKDLCFYCVFFTHPSPVYSEPASTRCYLNSFSKVVLVYANGKLRRDTNPRIQKRSLTTRASST